MAASPLFASLFRRTIALKFNKYAVSYGRICARDLHGDLHGDLDCDSHSDSDSNLDSDLDSEAIASVRRRRYFNYWPRVE